MRFAAARSLVLSLVSLPLLLIAACGSNHVVGNTIALGYTVGDSCSSITDQNSCSASSTCAWLPVAGSAGTSAGLCYTPDHCLAIGDQKACAATTGCDWSRAAKLCPAGANCNDGGYCHAENSTTCSCVAPVACPAGGTCLPPECDCGGSTGSSGGTCTCNAPACAPGQVCPPTTTCECTGSGSGTGCVTGTCVCGCPVCPVGEACSDACSCNCGNGPVPAPTPVPVSPTNGPAQPAAADPCAAFSDVNSCIADTTDQCVWISQSPPCPSTAVTCAVTSGCQKAVSTQPGGPCACNCPACPSGSTSCCACDCSGSGGGSDGGSSSDGGSTTCIPPAPTPSNGPVACPAIACTTVCPNGYTTGSDGCPTCTCK